MRSVSQLLAFDDDLRSWMSGIEYVLVTGLSYVTWMSVGVVTLVIGMHGATGRR